MGPRKAKNQPVLSMRSTSVPVVVAQEEIKRMVIHYFLSLAVNSTLLIEAVYSLTRGHLAISLSLQLRTLYLSETAARNLRLGGAKALQFFHVYDGRKEARSLYIPIPYHLCMAACWVKSFLFLLFLPLHASPFGWVQLKFELQVWAQPCLTSAQTTQEGSE